jgi:hypothetical protein
LGAIDAHALPVSEITAPVGAEIINRNFSLVATGVATVKIMTFAGSGDQIKSLF